MGLVQVCSDSKKTDCVTLPLYRRKIRLNLSFFPSHIKIKSQIKTYRARLCASIMSTLMALQCKHHNKVFCMKKVEDPCLLRLTENNNEQ